MQTEAANSLASPPAPITSADALSVHSWLVVHSPTYGYSPSPPAPPTLWVPPVSGLPPFGASPELDVPPPEVSLPPLETSLSGRSSRPGRLLQAAAVGVK